MNITKIQDGGRLPFKNLFCHNSAADFSEILLGEWGSSFFHRISAISYQFLFS